jgi:hypothetical protein
MEPGSTAERRIARRIGRSDCLTGPSALRHTRRASKIDVLPTSRNDMRDGLFVSGAFCAALFVMGAPAGAAPQ